ncbi:DUF7619 domain-containing protein [Flavobacterium pallidum]|uniref:Fibronectin type-III domain-containing protein n=1 Tax=Flavobacterium pallidum TaxID=2172098 RepID=A0A2S1SDX0_9FLAO|nr:T9SS type A sorting domain-containing protein [Flavobacterium pallidum]AWI24585.1 hypothetical protein HYN49_01025 [Flavobacterium pallidum]
MKKQLLKTFLGFFLLLSVSVFAQPGTTCENPISIALPYQDINDTANFLDTFDALQGTSCGVNPPNANCVGGKDVFYSFHATADRLVNIKLKPLNSVTRSSVFVYDGCANVGVSCIGGASNANAGVRNVTVSVLEGHDYIVLVSSGLPTQTFSYNLLIQTEDCLPIPTNGNIDGVTLNTAHLFWDAQGYSSWEVAVQPLGSLVPSGAGIQVNTPEYNASGLVSGTQYEYWVRGECTAGTGVWTAWAGPFAFDTMVCDASQTCNYTFRISNTSASGWGTARMQVRQNGLVVATLGSQLVTGTGPVDVGVPLCDGVPFDLYWNALGSNMAQKNISILNSFGQTIYTKPAGLVSLNGVLYDDVVACDAPRCDLTPTDVTVENVTHSGATINWSAAATTSWDICILPAGSPAPTADTVPTYDDVAPATTSFTTTLPLPADECYKVYVRVNCTPEPSAWSVSTANSVFCTVPLCPKPIDAGVIAASITNTSATFTWNPGDTADTQFELVLIAGPNAPTLPGTDTPATYVFSVPVGGPYIFTATDLNPATTYYAFIRSSCTPTGVSKCTPFPVFNTLTCNDQEKCGYKFLLTSPAGNSWNGAKIQIKQNGIIVAILGETQINTPAGITVPLCNGVPFDVFWSVAGTTPENIGVSIQNPFLDILYTKLPGTGTPNTVLFAAVGDCIQPACAKPTNITVSNITSGSATLQWTDTSVPAAPGYALYIVPTGGPGPSNNPPTAATITQVTNPFTVSAATGYALSPSTSYTFYVKSLCSASVESTWSILSPVTFITAPLNDNCADAIPVTINNTQQCVATNNVHGNTYGATASADAPAGTASGCFTTDDDVWFKFTATAPSLSINFYNMVGTPASVKVSHTLYSGTCGAFTKLYCSSTANTTAKNLIVGQMYYIRVYTPGSDPEQYVNFDLCITAPPANDEVEDAAPVSVSPVWACNPSLNVVGNTLGATASLPNVTGAGCGGSDDDVWFSFVATSNINIIAINDIITTNTNVAVNHTLFSGVPGDLVKIYCSSFNESVAQGLTIGATYYIRVYTSGTNAGASASFHVCVSTPPPPFNNDECATAIDIDASPTYECNTLTHGSLIGATQSTMSVTSCLTGQDDDVWFKFTAVSAHQVISLLNVYGTTVNLNHAVYSGTCGSMVLKYCSTANELTSHALNFVIGETYYLRVWSNAATSQVVVFDVCVKSVSSCENAQSFCGSSSDDPYIFRNTSGVPNSDQVACLGSIPNPTYYVLKISESGTLAFNILQNTEFGINGEPTGTYLDVDFAAWGPFEDNASFCSDIAFVDCPSCPNNTNGQSFYPFGNIVDCSYDASFAETMTIPNAVAGQYYVVLITNFNGNDGYIRISQTNAGEPGAGSTVCADKVRLIAYVDANNNGVKDDGELNFTEGNFIYQKNDSGPFMNISSQTGNYDLYSSDPSDSYDFTYQIFPEFAPYYTAASTGFSNISVSEGSGSQLLYFPLTPIQPYDDVSVNFVSVDVPLPGSNYHNMIVYKNKGLQPASGTITFTKDEAVTVTAVSQSGVTMTPNGFTYNFSGLLPYETRIINVTMAVPSIPEVSLGQLLNNTASITSTLADVHQLDNSASITQTIFGSFDPNDKTELHGGEVDINDLDNGGYLYYTIRFQNTGTYQATNVRLEDVLDDMLDESSLRVVSASHNYDLLRTGNHLTWEFTNIDLPAAANNEEESHGYVAFKVKPKPGYVIGDVISNEASIYFDSNPAIVTNTVQTQVSAPLSTEEYSDLNVVLYPNPTNTLVNINLHHTTEILDQVTLYDVLGKAVKQVKASHPGQIAVDVSGLAKGVYMVEIQTASKLRVIKKLVIN